MPNIRRNICILVLISAVIWTVQSSILPEWTEFADESGSDAAEPYDRVDSFNEWPSNRESREPEYNTDYEQQYNDDQQAFQQERVARQKKAKECQWLGCRKLPLGKGMLCPQGTFLESYKMCGSKRGGGTVDVQCCP